ncbi:hypothetical protein KP509_36G034900 [Ceratopteris richardii]|uniref:Reverse transcriptase domain-containing protein n=1 Tax=Ceratopteris richardii TaxID=49495 RepID=A0A8T2QC59_CERRI|nr:hypothetical protein KP509_36G034900 [Ceratopteris richardii]
MENFDLSKIFNRSTKEPQNIGNRPIVDEFEEAFVGHPIYSMVDPYFNDDQLQLVVESRDITTMKTPLSLVRMCTLHQGATNSVAHMMNTMNLAIHDFIPHIAMPFIDDIPIKSCLEKENDFTLDDEKCSKFVKGHIIDCEKILQWFIDVGLTLSIEKSTFGVNEVLILRKPIFLIVTTSPIGIGWVVGQEEEKRNRYAI